MSNQSMSAALAGACVVLAMLACSVTAGKPGNEPAVPEETAAQVTVPSPDHGGIVTPSLQPAAGTFARPDTGFVSGQVVESAAGQPLAGAHVVLENEVVVSDSDGRFLFQQVPPGPHALVATMDGYETGATAIFGVSPAKLSDVTVRMYAVGTFAFPADPLTANPIDVAGASTEDEALRLARLQGLTEAVESVQPGRLSGDFLVNWTLDDATYSVRTNLDCDGWALKTQHAEWRLARDGGNLAVPIGEDSAVMLVAFRSAPIPPTAPPFSPTAPPTPTPTAPATDTPALPPAEAPADTPKVVRPTQGDDLIAYQLSGDIFVVRPDGSDRRQLTHTPGVEEWHPHWSPDGERILFQCMEAGRSNVCRLGSEGTTQLTHWTEADGGAQRPRWSPDGSSIVVSVEYVNGKPGLVLMNADGSNQRRLTEGRDPDWSPDGTQITFMRFAGVSMQLRVINADGSGETVLLDGDKTIMYPTWSHDGSHIAFEYDTRQIVLFRLADGALRPVFDSGSWGMGWSPDSTRLVFADPAGGQWVVDVNTGSTWILAGEGAQPDWSPPGAAAHVFSWAGM